MKKRLLTLFLAFSTIVALARQQSKSQSLIKRSDLSFDTVLKAVSNTFAHPAILHTKADFERMRAKLESKTEPWKSGFEVFSDDSYSNKRYIPQGFFANVDRGSSNINRTAFESDCNAAYQLAIMWEMTGKTTYRDKVLDIICGWTSMNTTFSGKDAQLIVALCGFKLVNACEILRSNNSGKWSEEDIVKTENWISKKWWSWLQASGAPSGALDGNWGMAAIKCQAAISVFLNDREKFAAAINLMKTGCASIPESILANGQETETGRDNGHWQLALGDMAEYALIAYNNGIDVFALAGNRLLAGFEYFCKYQLGKEVSYIPWKTCLTKVNYMAISPRNNTFRPIFEMVYNHYKQKGIQTPYMERVVAQARPEGSVGGSQTADHPGFGTLFYSR